jgi:hypothetical protein
MKPWRNVVNTRRDALSETGSPTVIQRLDCGHELTFIGQAATKAHEAERRRCEQCPVVEKPLVEKRRREKRSYILISDADF